MADKTVLNIVHDKLENLKSRLFNIFDDWAWFLEDPFHGTWQFKQGCQIFDQ